MFISTPGKKAAYFAEVSGRDSDRVTARIMDPQGVLKAVGHYADEELRIPDGHFTFYYGDGTVESTGEYDKGNKDGIWLRYDGSGRPLAEKVYDSSVLDDLVYTRSQIPPSCSGGRRALTKYVKQKVGKVHGQVEALFIVEKDGHLTDMKVVGAENTELSGKIAAAIGDGPQWQAGQQNGQPVRVQMRVPLK
jgi:protein TonB